MRGFSGAVNKSVGKSMPAIGNKAGRSLGSRMASAAGTAIKTTAKVGFLAAGAAAGATLVGGFQTAIKRQTSTRVLEGLYGDAKLAGQTLKDLRQVSKSSPLDYTSYTKAAESLAYAGIEGKSATGVLENIGKTIVATGGSSEKLDQAMGGVMKAVNNGGIAMMDSLGMISESGVPILSALGEDMGLTIDKVKKLASEGKINVSDVMRVMGDESNKAMQKYMKAGDSASKSFANQWSMAKDNVVNAVANQMMPALDKLAPVVGRVGNKLAGWIENVDLTPFINGVKSVAGWFGQLDFSSWDKFVSSLSSGGGSEAMKSIGDSVKKLGPAFQKFAQGLKNAAPEIATLGAGGVTILAGALGFLADHVDTIIKYMPLIIAGFIAWRVASNAIANATLGLRAAELLMAPVLLANNLLRNNSARIEARLAAAKTSGVVATTASTGAENVNLLTRLRNVAATVAQRVATTAATIATRAAAAGQWLLNAAMSANPIGLIIAGIAALVAGLIWFFTQTKVGKAVITAVWSAIKTAIGAVVNWFTGSVVPWLQAAMANIGAFFRSMGAVVKTVWNGIKSAINVVWQFIKNYVFTPIKNFVMKTIPNAFKFLVSAVKTYINMWKLVLNTVWNWVKRWVFTPIKNFVTKTIPDAFKYFVAYVKSRIQVWRNILSAAWRFVKTYVFNPIKNFVTKTIPDAFKLFVRYIKSRMTNFKNNLNTIWQWVKKHVFNPMKNFITETVPNAFETGVDSIKKFWDKLKKIASKPMKFVVDTVYNNGLVKLWNPIAGFIGKDDWKLKKVDVSKFATGGRVSGPGTSTSDSVPARLSNNEHVLSAKDVKNLGGHGSVYGLRAAAAKGWTPGLATGGTLSDAARWLQSKGARITEFGAWGQRVGKHSNGSLHYSGKAFDANYGPGGENATEKSFFDRNIGRFHELFPKLRTIWRAAGHFNHFHADTGNGGNVGSGGSGGGGGGGWIPGLDTLVSGLKGKLDGMGGQGRIRDGMVSLGGKLIDGLADKARSVFDVFGGGGGGGGGNVPAGDVVAGVRSVAKSFGWDSGQQWKSLRWIIDKESSWDPNAANPNSSARGLFQKMTSIHGALEDTVEGQARWGLNYIKGRYTNPISAQGFHRSHGYYAKGTRNAARGWATVGEEGPELIKLRGGEQIKSNRASQRFVNANQDAARPVFHVEFHGQVDDANDVVSKLQFEMNRFYSGGRYAR